MTVKKEIAARFILVLLAGVMLAGCKKKEESDSSREVVEEREAEEGKAEEGKVEEATKPESASLSYVEEHGLEFFQGTVVATKGVRYNEEHPEDYEVIDVEAEITEITVADAEEAGFQTITIKAERRGETWADFSSGDPQGNNKLRFTAPGFFLCDIYTGRIVPYGEMSTADGTVAVRRQTDLEWGGESYSISYLREMETEFGEWSGDFHPFTVYSTYSVIVPEDYDGLALLMAPRTEYEELDTELEEGTEEYILDEWKEDSYLLRVSDLMELL